MRDKATDRGAVGLLDGPPGAVREASDHQAQAKERYLGIAARLASDGSGPSGHYALAYVPVNDVADAACVTRSAIYRVWPCRQDFWADLAEYVLVGDAPSRVPARQGPAGGEEPLATAFDAAHGLLMADPRPLLRAAVVAYPGGTPLVTALGEQRRDVVADLASRVAAHLRLSRRGCVGGVTVDEVAAAMTLLSTGLALAGRMAPDQELRVPRVGGERGGPEPGTLLGALLMAILDGLSGPERPGEGAFVPLEEDPRRLVPRHPSPAAGEVGAGDGDPVAKWTGRHRRYLELGASLALAERSDYSQVLGHLALDTLGRAAKVTRRTLSNVWPDQAQFRLDLFGYLLERERQWVRGAVRKATQVGLAAGDAAGAFVALGEHIHAKVLDHACDVGFAAFAPHLDAPDIARRGRWVQGWLADEVAYELRNLLAAVGRTTSTGVSLRQLALALFSVSDGAQRLVRTRRDLLCADVDWPGHGSSLVGCTVAAVLEGLTEPLGGSSDANAFAAWLS